MPKSKRNKQGMRFVILNLHPLVVTLMLFLRVIEIGSEGDGFVDLSEKTQLRYRRRRRREGIIKRP